MSSSVTVRNNVVISGKGKIPVLFAHGFGCDQTMWRFITPSFEKDYKVILFDYAGHGKSAAGAYSKKKYSSLDGYAQDILDIVEELKLKDVVLVGHSVSNMIAVLAANKRPGLFKCLVMIGASPRYMNDPGYAGGFEKKDLESMLSTMEKDYKGWVHYLAEATMKNPGQPELRKELEKVFLEADRAVIRQFAETTFFSDNREDVKKLKTPVLILQSNDDVIAPAAVTEYLSKNIPGSKVKKLKASGHCPHMSAPRETSEAILAFLQKLEN